MYLIINEKYMKQIFIEFFDTNDMREDQNIINIDEEYLINIGYKDHQVCFHFRLLRSHCSVISLSFRHPNGKRVDDIFNCDAIYLFRGQNIDNIRY